MNLSDSNLPRGSWKKKNVYGKKVINSAPSEALLLREVPYQSNTVRNEEQQCSPPSIACDRGVQ